MYSSSSVARVLTHFPFASHIYICVCVCVCVRVPFAASSSSSIVGIAAGAAFGCILLVVVVAVIYVRRVRKTRIQKLTSSFDESALNSEVSVLCKVGKGRSLILCHVCVYVCVCS